MELALSLGDASMPSFPKFVDKSQQKMVKDLGFCMGLPSSPAPVTINEKTQTEIHEEEKERRVSSSSESDPPSPVPLDLLPFSPVPRNHQQPSFNSLLPLPWITHNLMLKPDSSTAAEEAVSSPNRAASSFQMEFPSMILYREGRRKRDSLETSEGNDAVGTERASSRASDDDENELTTTRKKLRLSQQQSAFLEDSFKEHHTLSPKQKLALAKQLNLRPRQVEVWFQNRRARTKLKQTEVDCEFMRSRCERLREENRRLQKEVQELRALKTNQPLFMQQQLPPTTLTMCPSCTTTSTTTTTTVAATNLSSISNHPRFYPFSAASTS